MFSTYFTAARGGIDLRLGFYGSGILDPGWYFSTFSDKGRGKSRRYLCQSLDQLMALPVGELFLDDAAVALWLTQYAIAKGWHRDVFHAWGFEPQTTGSWKKLTAR